MKQIRIHGEKSINYKGGYKYQLKNGYSIYIGFPAGSIGEWLKIESGTLYIHNRYAWDGPSGPTIDTDNFLRGSLVHDALYQMMREGAIPESCRKDSDIILYWICREDGMSWIRATWVYWGVNLFGAKNARANT